jgi:hypothetical protein
LRKPKTSISVLFLLKILISAAAYFYIYYRIRDSISKSNGLSFGTFTFDEVFCLFLAFIMMIPNWLLESAKWKKLILHLHEASFLSATQSVLVGITCSIFTPYRLGEYFGRPIFLPKEKRTSGVLANIIGSISQNIVTYSLGIVGTILYISSIPENQMGSSSQTAIVFALILLNGLFLLFYFQPSILINFIRRFPISEKRLDKFEFIKHYSKRELLLILFIGFARYLIFFTQYYLLLLAFDIKINIIEAFTAISLSYVFLFSIPGIPIADIGIRGSLALFFLGIYSKNEIGIISASSSLWVINLAIPAIIGSIILMQHKKKD